MKLAVPLPCQQCCVLERHRYKEFVTVRVARPISPMRRLLKCVDACAIGDSDYIRALYSTWYGMMSERLLWPGHHPARCVRT